MTLLATLLLAACAPTQQSSLMQDRFAAPVYSADKDSIPTARFSGERIEQPKFEPTENPVSSQRFAAPAPLTNRNIRVLTPTGTEDLKQELRPYTEQP
jgi:hypothetical protein